MTESDPNADRARAAPSSAAPGEPEPARPSRRERLELVLRRVAYWSPVLVALVLFAQVSFLGLRPALCEAGRLAAAEETLEARHAQASALNREIQLQLVAREDPLFRERQRRLRTIRTEGAERE